MHGVPLSMCQDAMIEAIGHLRPVDTFNVITFAGSTAKLFEKARPANDTNIKAALELVTGLRAGGGTMMADGVAAALSPDVGDGRHRYVFFLTDGYVGNDQQIIGMVGEFIKKLGKAQQRARVFSFGVGSSTNRFLLDGIASTGDGLAVYASTRQDPLIAVNSFYHYIDHAVMTDIQVDWGDLTVSEVYPQVVPDMFASRPVILHGKLSGKGRNEIKVSGRIGKKLVSLPATVELGGEGNGAVIATLWARAKVNWLERGLAFDGGSSDTVEAITQLGLSHRLVTRYTSLVAVDRSKKVTGDLKTIVQPVEVPEGVDASMAAPPSAVYGKASGAAYAPVAAESAADGAPLRRYKARGPTSVPPVTKPEERKDGGRLSNLTVRGSIGRSSIETLVQSHLADLDRILRESGAGKAGTVKVRFFVAAGGKLLQVRVTAGSLTDKALLASLKAEIATWKLAAPPSGDTVEVSFTLSLHD
jgi:Ca-activated chloride channel family protein